MWLLTLLYLAVSLIIKIPIWIGMMLLGKWEHPELRRLNSAISLLPPKDNKPKPKDIRRTNQRRKNLHND